MAGQSSGALCYHVHRLSIQFSLRISFAKQRQRSDRTDQANGLQVVTRHLDLGWSGQPLRLAIDSERAG